MLQKTMTENGVTLAKIPANTLRLMKCFSVYFEFASFTACPFKLARGGGSTSCERKPAVATAGEEDALFLPSIPCS